MSGGGGCGSGEGRELWALIVGGGGGGGGGDRVGSQLRLGWKGHLD